MKSRHSRWLVTLLASLIGVGVVAGCSEEASWEHPNRQRYAAPPEAKNDTMSIEELQRVWKRQDQQQLRQENQQQSQRHVRQPVRQQPVRQQPVRQQPVRQQSVRQHVQRQATVPSTNCDVLDLATEHLSDALEAIVNSAGVNLQSAGEHKALGGGPAPGTAPPVDNGTGDM